MMIYTMLYLPEFEELSSHRLQHAQYLITVIRENMESGFAQPYEKSIADLEGVLTQLHSIKIDLEIASIRVAKELANDKN